jgi:hypothetical protein
MIYNLLILGFFMVLIEYNLNFRLFVSSTNIFQNSRTSPDTQQGLCKHLKNK